MAQDLPPLVFFGSGYFGLPVLRDLADAGVVKLVVSQPDKPAGRGGACTPTPVSAWALERGLPLLRPQDCNAPEVVRQVHAAAGQPPVFVVIAYGQKMGAQLLEGAFAINLHGSLLPRWRGAAPYQRALMAGDARAGVTVIAVAERMDAGAMFASADLPIGPRMTAGELHDALSELGPAVILDVLRRWRAAGGAELRGQAQDEVLVTRAHKLSRADAWVDLAESADAVRARINGLSPWPGCQVMVNGHPLKVLRAEQVLAESGAVAAQGSSAAPGTILPDGTIACGSGVIRFLEVQPPGGRTMPFEDWCRGRRVQGGMRVERAPPVLPASPQGGGSSGVTGGTAGGGSGGKTGGGTG